MIYIYAPSTTQAAWMIQENAPNLNGATVFTNNFVLTPTYREGDKIFAIDGINDAVQWAIRNSLLKSDHRPKVNHVVGRAR